MTKDELIARLQVLGEQLNRDVSLTGTKEELALRVAELEEELDDTDDAAGQDTSVSPENALMGIPTSPVSRWCSVPVSRSSHRRRGLNPPAPRRCWVRK